MLTQFVQVNLLLTTTFFKLLFPWQDAYRHEHTGVFPGKMCSYRPEGTSYAIFGVETAAKCCAVVPTEFAASPRRQIS